MNDKVLNEMLNTVHIPEDAGEHADDLRRILDRIPEGWGRWISCDKGWYPLIIELDRKLAKIAPDYELHQVKEKFGTLSYYIGLPNLEPQCCIDLEATRPYDGPISPKWRLSSKDKDWNAEKQHELDKWYYEIYLPHQDSQEHIDNWDALDPEFERRSNLYTEMYKIIDEYEELSARTCELCETEAETKARNYWLKTLCEPCAEKNGYMPIPEEDNEDDD